MPKRDGPAKLQVRNVSLEPDRVAAVAALLQQEVRVGRLNAGDRLPPEASLAQDAGVSRTVVREAIAELRALGLLETRRGAGVFVASAPSRLDFGKGINRATLDNILSVLEVRLGLEIEAASLAAARRTDEDLGSLEKAIETAELNIQSSEAIVQGDMAFHTAIARATKNPLFADMCRYLGYRAFPRRHLDLGVIPDYQIKEQNERITGEHRSILDAIRARDSVMASAEMRIHLAGSRSRYQALSAIRLD